MIVEEQAQWGTSNYISEYFLVPSSTFNVNLFLSYDDDFLDWTIQEDLSLFGMKPCTTRNLLINCPQQQRQAHESPVIFYSCILGSIGPIMVLTVPPLRERMGYKPAEMIPSTYPCTFEYLPYAS